jgi:hypothetical protein
VCGGFSLANKRKMRGKIMLDQEPKARMAIGLHRNRAFSLSHSEPDQIF